MSQTTKTGTQTTDLGNEGTPPLALKYHAGSQTLSMLVQDRLHWYENTTSEQKLRLMHVAHRALCVNGRYNWARLLDVLAYMDTWSTAGFCLEGVGQFVSMAAFVEFAAAQADAVRAYRAARK